MRKMVLEDNGLPTKHDQSDAWRDLSKPFLNVDPTAVEVFQSSFVDLCINIGSFEDAVESHLRITGTPPPPRKVVKKRKKQKSVLKESEDEEDQDWTFGGDGYDDDDDDDVDEKTKMEFDGDYDSSSSEEPSPKRVRRKVDVPPASCRNMKDETSRFKCTQLTKVTKQMQSLTTLTPDTKRLAYPQSSYFLAVRDEVVINPHRAKKQNFRRPEGKHFAFLVPAGETAKELGQDLLLVANNMIEGNNQNYIVTEERKTLEDYVMGTAESRNRKKKKTKKTKKKRS
jgi:hypothetical protein